MARPIARSLSRAGRAAVAGAAAGLVALAVAGTVAVLGPGAGGADAGGAGIVIVEVAGAAADPEGTNRRLAGLGAGVRVGTTTVTPQLVGTWIHVSSDGSVDEAVFDRVTAESMGFAVDVRVPRSVDGLTLTVGVAPRDGEQPRVNGFRNAFAPGGPLECSPARSAEVSEARRSLERAGYESVTLHTIPDLDEEVTPGPGDIATAAFVVDNDPGAVRVVILDREDPRLEAQLGLGFAPGQTCA